MNTLGGREKDNQHNYYEEAPPAASSTTSFVEKFVDDYMGEQDVQLTEEEIRILEVMDNRVRNFLRNADKPKKKKTPEQRARERKEKRRNYE